MWHRSGGVALLACALGCGDAEPTAAEPAPAPAETEGTGEDGEDTVEQPAGETSSSGFTLSIDGWTDSLGSKAQLNVVEGEPVVRLEITGSGRRDVVLMDVGFDGLEDSWRPHHWDVGLPGQGWHSTIASIDGVSYHSQGGHVDVSLSVDGRITGSFEVALAEDPATPVGEPIVYVKGETARTLSGSFAGEWELYCQSRLPGHRSLTRGGEYCEGLALE